MVKNSGGNKSKKQARKGVSGAAPSQNVRYIADTGEMYAVITNIYGGKTCQVMCHDGVSRRCTIRKKFMMARRGENMLATGTWLMVGLYDWEKRADGSQTCDILEVYSSGEREKLKQTINSKLLKPLMVVNNAMDGNKNGHEVLFSDTLVAAEGDGGDEDDDEADDDDDEADDDDDEKEKKKPIIPLKDLPVVRNETAKAQTDWMTVVEDDI
jgi:hypothetical protein